MPRRKKSVPVADVPTQDEKQEELEGVTLNVEDAPAEDLPERGFVDNILGKLGLSPSPSPTEKPASSFKGAGRLTKSQQAVVDQFTPLASTIVVASFGWAWARIGEPYRQLRPSDEVATKMIAPIIRIYARTMKVSVTGMNANTLDLLASLTATLGYIFASLQTYEVIKQQIALEEEQNGFSATSQNGHNSTGSGFAHLQPSSNGHDYEAAARPSDLIGDHLTADQREQFDRLSVLRQRDIEARARRSGRGA